ncbi:cobalt-precorrin 5A hydrolase [Pseudomonas alcaligenes]|nr:cobalt-precorrin 5A hydrolase [Pseudomonas alcaligenes]
MTLVAGLGCRRGCSEQELRALLDAALAELGLVPGHLSALASVDSKADEPGLQALALTLRLPLALLPAAQLAACEGRLSGLSAIALRETGSPGIAEAAALVQAEALAGRPARLLVEKRRSANATCALACTLEDVDNP